MRILCTDKTDNLPYEIIYDNLKIIAFQTITNHSFWTFYIGGKPVVYVISRKSMHPMWVLGNTRFISRWFNMIYTLEINLVFLCTYVLFSIIFIIIK